MHSSALNIIIEGLKDIFQGDCFVWEESVTSPSQNIGTLLPLCHIHCGDTMRYANNKDADKPADPCSLISTFVTCCCWGIFITITANVT